MVRRVSLVVLIAVLGCRPGLLDVDDEAGVTTNAGESSDDHATDTSVLDTESSETESESSETESSDSTTGEPNLCGNGQIDEGEQCDGDSRPFTCEDLGYQGGTLVCDPLLCTLDASGCGFLGRTCGNATIDGLGEVCDGDELDGQSCVSLGFVDGTLSCTPPCLDDGEVIGCSSACLFDTSDCLAEGEGSPCMSEADCLPSAPFCTDNACWNGGEGDPCLDGAGCQPDFACIQGTCFDGNELDPCLSDDDCMAPANQCALGQCHDGWFESPCETQMDCDPPLFCLPDIGCWGL